ncbi:dihydrodipicolinate synthase family protein [Pleomorphomonas carboxyditropha]|uniref:Dihydrodipicolinate synthase family protein n=1 Tax=Pleomorphomonas carboxyditropha TaxID=2023338 RepID=A0A2G9WP08_9HYPH|nr:dihydrodipicolinate synthase family protein [Pleomorphomonas carboxyditropha]PIO96451.1 dihydrodipicolinate synthase family protein [Pleomorphomonas carboxyditropha]
MQSFKLKGVIPPVPTIVDQTGAFDPKGMAALLEREVAAGIHGLLILGSGGEFCHMNTAMRKEVAEFCVRQVAGRIPVLIGIGASATAEVIELGRHAQSCGADAVLVVNPYYATLSQRALIQHYKTVAAAVDLPILLYNFPALTGQELTVDLVQELALACPNIVGIKDTVDTMSHTRALVTEVKGARPDFLVFSGFDEYMLDTLLIGGDGGIPATANFAPEVTLGIYDAIEAGDFTKMRAHARRLARLMPIYGLDQPFFGLVKEAIRLTGSDLSMAVLAPSLPPSAENKHRLVTVLRGAGVLPSA